MADITMCKDYLCPSREKCRRYMANPDILQSYFTKEMRVSSENSCNQFIEWYTTDVGFNKNKRLEKDYKFMKQEIESIGELSQTSVSAPEKPSQPVYYMCYVVGGRNPTYKHETLEQAKAEAERLAKITSQPVVILKSYLEVMVEVKTRTIKY